MASGLPPIVQIPNPDRPWLMRASKACCHCRRDKIKCDRERPCSACVRKGWSDVDCIDGCQPCRRVRARCDGGSPCSHCVDMGINCVDEPTSPSLAQDDASNGSSSNGTRSFPAGRAKLACLACRRDNKKCNNSRPCLRCLSRSEECIHVDRNPKSIRYRCVSCRKDNKKCEDNRPCQNCVDNDLQCIDVPRKGFRGRRLKAACTNCRRHKVQCGSERPCPPCARRGFECVETTCTCPKTGSEPGSCSFCRAQGRNGSSETSDHPSGSHLSEFEGQDELPDTPLSTLSFPGFNELTGFLGNIANETESGARGNKNISEQQMEHIFASADHPNVGAQGGTSDAKSSAAQQYAYHQHPSSFGYYSHMGAQTPQCSLTPSQAHQFLPGCQSSRSTLPSLKIENIGIGGGGSLDRSFAGRMGIDLPSRSGHMSEIPSQTDFIPPHQSSSWASYLLPLPSYSTSSSLNNALGVGIGAYTPEGATTFSLKDIAPSPEPMPMPIPVSIMMVIPQSLYPLRGPASPTHSTGQMDMHPQARRDSYHLPSNSSFDESRKEGPSS